MEPIALTADESVTSKHVFLQILNRVSRRGKLYFHSEIYDCE